MLHEVKLIFGYDYYYGDITVSPQDMLVFLQKPFKHWLYQKTWDGFEINGWQESDFHNYVFESMSHYNDEDFFFEPNCAEWLGFRVSLDQEDSEAEFVFTTQTINGEIRPDLDKISTDLTNKLLSAKSYINQALQGIKRNK